MPPEADETKIQALARKRESLLVLQSLVKDQLKEVEFKLEVILKKYPMVGMALLQEEPSICPKWKEEWQNLCLKLGMDPSLEEQEIRAKIQEEHKKMGKKNTKLAIDSSFSPDESIVSKMFELLKGL